MHTTICNNSLYSKLKCVCVPLIQAMSFATQLAPQLWLDTDLRHGSEPMNTQRTRTRAFGVLLGFRCLRAIWLKIKGQGFWDDAMKTLNPEPNLQPYAPPQTLKPISPQPYSF